MIRVVVAAGLTGFAALIIGIELGRHRACAYHEIMVGKLSGALARQCRTIQDLRAGSPSHRPCQREADKLNQHIRDLEDQLDDYRAALGGGQLAEETAAWLRGEAGR